MAEQYIRDPAGIVHVMLPYGDGEFTCCGRDTAQADNGGFEGVLASGPATCSECLSAFVRLQVGLKGARFAAVLVDPE